MQLLPYSWSVSCRYVAWRLEAPYVLHQDLGSAEPNEFNPFSWKIREREQPWKSLSMMSPCDPCWTSTFGFHQSHDQNWWPRGKSSLSLLGTDGSQNWGLFVRHAERFTWQRKAPKLVSWEKIPLNGGRGIAVWDEGLLYLASSRTSLLAFDRRCIASNRGLLKKQSWHPSRGNRERLTFGRINNGQAFFFGFIFSWRRGHQKMCIVYVPSTSDSSTTPSDGVQFGQCSY